MQDGAASRTLTANAGTKIQNDIGAIRTGRGHSPASVFVASVGMKGALLMRYLLTIALLFGLSGCAALTPPVRSAGSTPLVAAERLIDAFYSFDPDPLRAAMADAAGSQPQIVFYQGWAQGGNYKVLKRQQCQFSGEAEVTCAITVQDDLIVALGTGFWVTDKFHLKLDGERIVKVRTSSNDPPEFDLALIWLKREQPGLMTGPCRGFFAGGPTPGDCVRAVVSGFKAFRVSKQSE